MSKLCPNCEICRKVFLTENFCDPTCKLVYLMRLEKTAFVKEDLKYPEYIKEMKSIMLRNDAPDIKLKPLNALMLIGRGNFFT